eukprot:scaffold1301_cov363-Pavlova_lutheri.AAC.2
MHVTQVLRSTLRLVPLFRLGHAPFVAARPWISRTRGPGASFLPGSEGSRCVLWSLEMNSGYSRVRSIPFSFVIDDDQRHAWRFVARRKSTIIASNRGGSFRRRGPDLTEFRSLWRTFSLYRIHLLERNGSQFHPIGVEKCAKGDRRTTTNVFHPPNRREDLQWTGRVIA